MTVFSALSLAGVLFVTALAVGFTVGARLAPRAIQRRQRVTVEAAGITVAQMLERIVALMPLGAAVVDRHRDVVYHNGRAKELGLVRERQLDDEAWKAARRTLADGDHWYEYPRYTFSNKSRDILGLCGTTLDRLGVDWRYARWDVISVAKRDGLARLDEFVGPKY